MYSFPSLEPDCCSLSSSSCCSLTCIQISQEAGQMVWYSHLFNNFPVLYTTSDLSLLFPHAPSLLMITVHQTGLPVLCSSFPIPVLHLIMYIYQFCFLPPQGETGPTFTLSFPHCVHKFIFYVCVSITYL